MGIVISNKKNAWGLYEARSLSHVAYFGTLTEACMNAEEVLIKASVRGPGTVKASGVPYEVEEATVAFGMRK